MWSFQLKNLNSLRLNNLNLASFFDLFLPPYGAVSPATFAAEKSFNLENAILLFEH